MVVGSQDSESVIVPITGTLVNVGFDVVVEVVVIGGVVTTLLGVSKVVDSTVVDTGVLVVVSGTVVFKGIVMAVEDSGVATEVGTSVSEAVLFVVTLETGGVVTSVGDVVEFPGTRVPDVVKGTLALLVTLPVPIIVVLESVTFATGVEI